MRETLYYDRNSKMKVLLLFYFSKIVIFDINYFVKIFFQFKMVFFILNQNLFIDKNNFAAVATACLIFVFNLFPRPGA